MTAATLPALPDLVGDRADLDRLLMIRHFELALLDLFATGEVNGTTHTCLGQEYVPVALRTLLHEADFVFSNHRGHGHYLSRFDDPAGLLAEITGREGGVCGGVGGSQHLRRDRYLSTGVQGESLPLAAGAALHLSRAEPGRLACVFIGDGTWGQGAVYEALNMAALWRLPLLVVVENNGIAQSTPTSAQLAGTIAGRAAAFGVAYEQVVGISLVDIRGHLARPVRLVREGAGPLVVEFDTVRLGPHSKGDDLRPVDEVAALRERDWHRQYAATLGEAFVAADRGQRARIAETFREVLDRPFVRAPGGTGSIQ